MEKNNFHFKLKLKTEQKKLAGVNSSDSRYGNPCMSTNEKTVFSLFFLGSKIDTTKNTPRLCTPFRLIVIYFETVFSPAFPLGPLTIRNRAGSCNNNNY